MWELHHRQIGELSGGTAAAGVLGAIASTGVDRVILLDEPLVNGLKNPRRLFLR